MTLDGPGWGVEALSALLLAPRTDGVKLTESVVPGCHQVGDRTLILVWSRVPLPHPVSCDHKFVDLVQSLLSARGMVLNC